ncbi:MAG: hypothetical protein KDK25_00895, partial [Leptospiraceae bacterium]|nr:hypothetical protein [Leptospiraceae bacterium]
MIYVLVFSGLLIAIFGYLIVVVFFPGFDFPPEKLILRGHAAPPADSLPFREDVEFLVDGQRVRGWFYWSSGSSGPVAPCIIMATGLGGTRRMGLEHYALFYRA